jgi:phosphoribosyl 1,2-cyclic phosphodiesterase
MSDFKVKFWGVRGSYPMPGESTVEFGGNTTCIEIAIGDQMIIIDAGTGIIKLGDRLLAEYLPKAKPIIATILFTHMHHDHNQGFPFFKPAYIGTSVLYLFGPKFFQEDIEEVLAHAMLPPFFPVEIGELNSARIVHTIHDSEVILIRKREDFHPTVFNPFRDKINRAEDDIFIEIMKGSGHPKGGVINYRINYRGKSVVIATDNEGYLWGDRKLIAFAKDADLLIHDTQYTKEEYSGEAGVIRQGWGHSTPEMAVEVAEQAQVGRLIITHHDPAHSDSMVKNIEKQCRKKFKKTDASYEGMEIDLL